VRRRLEFLVQEFGEWLRSFGNARRMAEHLGFLESAAVVLALDLNFKGLEERVPSVFCLEFRRCRFVSVATKQYSEHFRYNSRSKKETIIQGVDSLLYTSPGSSD